MKKPRRRRSVSVACVLGDMDLVRPLGLAGIRSVPVGPPRAPTSYSRFTVGRIDKTDLWEEPEEQVDLLLRFGRAQKHPPILFYEDDAPLLIVSRYRERLRQAFRFVVGEQDLIETIVDKARFQQLAEGLGLPIPRSRALAAGADAAQLSGLRYPLVVKPLTRQTDVWAAVAERAKAIRVDGSEALRVLISKLDAIGIDVLVQELVEGAETRIESYHAYIDDQGDVAGEFTGRKLRTNPPTYGHSTALETTGSEEVAEAGRAVLRRLGLHGVAKVDFKRTPDGDLRLLEVNPRFTLWHHLGAVAGVNLPALVYADLTGTPRRPISVAKPGVRWCAPGEDLQAVRAAGVPVYSWLALVLRSRARSTLALDDPMPFIRGRLVPRLQNVVTRGAS